MDLDFLVAVVAVSVASLSALLSFASYLRSSRHDRLSVRPIAQVSTWDGVDSLEVRIDNHGTGPLTIIDFRVTNIENGETQKSVVGFAKRVRRNFVWAGFAGDITNRAIPAGGQLRLLKFRTSLVRASEPIAVRMEVREALAPLICRLVYKDIYGQRFATERELEVFGRPLDPLSEEKDWDRLDGPNA